MSIWLTSNNKLFPGPRPPTLRVFDLVYNGFPLVQQVSNLIRNSWFPSLQSCHNCTSGLTLPDSSVFQFIEFTAGQDFCCLYTLSNCIASSGTQKSSHEERIFKLSLSLIYQYLAAKVGSVFNYRAFTSSSSGKPSKITKAYID